MGKLRWNELDQEIQTKTGITAFLDSWYVQIQNVSDPIGTQTEV